MESLLQAIADLLAKIGRVGSATLFDTNSTFSLASLAAALVLACAVIVVGRLRRRGRISLRVLVKALAPRRAVLGASGKADLGYFFFNTFGNLALDPRAGLVFVDWSSGDVLALTGVAEVIWDGAELSSFAGAQRLLKVRVIEARWLPGAMPWRSAQVEYAAQLAATGSWDTAAEAPPTGG